MWWISDFFDDNGNNVQRLGFVPAPQQAITVTSPQVINLNNNINLQALCQITVSDEGRVFIIGPIIYFPNQSVTGLIVKEPGPLSLDLVSPCVTVFDNVYYNAGAQSPYQFPISYPSPYHSYEEFLNSIVGVIYDNDRKLLYVSFNNRPDRNSQDFHQFIIASADNGRTWGSPLYIPKTSMEIEDFFHWLIIII